MFQRKALKAVEGRAQQLDTVEYHPPRKLHGAALAARWKTTDLPYAVTPALYACPNAVHDLGQERHGCAFVMSPWGQVAAG